MATNNGTKHISIDTRVKQQEAVFDRMDFSLFTSLHIYAELVCGRFEKTGVLPAIASYAEKHWHKRLYIDTDL